MKTVSASQARQNWFRLLDEAVLGQVIAIDRNGTRLILRAEKVKKTVPNYKGLISGKNLEDADKWGWEWSESAGLAPVDRK